MLVVVALIIYQITTILTQEIELSVLVVFGLLVRQLAFGLGIATATLAMRIITSGLDFLKKPYNGGLEVVNLYKNLGIAPIRKSVKYLSPASIQTSAYIGI